MDSLEPLRVPVTRYCYRAVKGYGAFKYKLHQIKQSEQSFVYPLENIEKVAPTAYGLKQLALFNQLYVPQCNSIGLQFAFTEDDNREYVFLLGERLWLVHEPSDAGPAVCEWQGIKNSEVTHSTMSMIHSLLETNNGFFHIGISLVPSCGMHMPLWLSSETMQNCVQEWATLKIPYALKKSIVTVAYKAGKTCVYSARGICKSMALRSYQPWLTLE